MAVVFEGIGVSPGIAIAPALVLERRVSRVPKFDLAADHIEPEVRRLDDAVAAVHEQLVLIEQRADRELGTGIAQIIDAQRLMLEDRVFVGAIRDRIRRLGQNAEWAAKAVGDDLSERFARIADSTLRARRNDLDDIANRLLRTLSGSADFRLDNVAEPVVVVAYDLSPSDTVMLDRAKIVGFVTDVGGRTSHTAIMARSLEIPAIVGLHDATERVRSGDPVVMDGNEGLLIARPGTSTVGEYENRRRAYAERDAELLQTVELPSVTRDGVSVTLLANVESAAETDAARRYGAQGIGLFRSEFMYLRRPDTLPTSDDHFNECRAALEAMAPAAVTVRTLDLGAEKSLPGELKRLQGAASLLGLRAIRHSLHEREMFLDQLRGLYRASAYGDLRIVLPFITGVEEIHAVKALIGTVRAELEAAGEPLAAHVPLGAMLEVPSAALIADHLAGEVDFFSIGTNDLIQYLLAVDRNNDAVAHLYEPLHPAVLRVLERIVGVARERGLPVTLCGETAADPLTAMLYLGFGIEELSMTPGSIPVIKNLVRRLTFAEAQAMLQHALRCGTAREVEEFALERLMAHFPDGFLGGR